MRQKLLVLIAVMLPLMVMSQGIITRPGKGPTKSSKMQNSSVKKKQRQSGGPQTGTLNGHEWVDLGLSVKWATMNVGATSPSDYGGYYAWGETITKSSYDWDNYFDSLDGTGNSFRTYKRGSQSSINPTSGHDTARENWGSTWRMPTSVEGAELRKKCKWVGTDKDGHAGYTVTGPNGNSIFLPISGYCSGTETRYVGISFNYWLSSIEPSSPDIANFLYVPRDDYDSDMMISRELGLCVRPVTE